MTIALWISLATLVLIAAVTLKLTVRLLAPKIDNGWDNAIGYVLASALLFLFPVRWMSGAGWLFLFVAPLFCWTVQTLTLRWIYQVDLGRAWLIGVVHALFHSTLSLLVTFLVGMVVAYFVYGQIIADPVRVILVILKLLGIKLPFGSDSA